MSSTSTIKSYFIYEFFLNNADFRLQKIRNYLDSIKTSAVLDESDILRMTNFSAFFVQRRLTFDHLVKSYITRDLLLKNNANITCKILSLSLALGFFQNNYEAVLPELKITLRRFQNVPVLNSLLNSFMKFFNRFGYELPEIKAKDRERELSIKYSCPLELTSFLVSEIGRSDAESVMASSLVPPKVTFRLNSYAIPGEEEREIFLKEFAEKYFLDLTHVYDYDPLIFAANRGAFGFSLTDTEEFKLGFITPMGPSAYLAAKILQPAPDEIILDACASPGNKTCHIAESTDCAARVIGVDVSASKVEKIFANVKRLKLNNVFAVEARSELISADEIKAAVRGIGEKEGGLFDKILLDAPCSGLGLLRNRVELKYRFSAHDTTKMTAAQSSLLANTSSLLKPGGLLLYSTCTINRRENSEMVDSFLASHPDFDSLNVSERLGKNYLSSLPVCDSAGGGGRYLQVIPCPEEVNEGFFFALLIKKERSRR